MTILHNGEDDNRGRSLLFNLLGMEALVVALMTYQYCIDKVQTARYWLWGVKRRVR